MAKYFWGNGAGTLTPSDAGNPGSLDRPIQQQPQQHPAAGAQPLAAGPAPASEQAVSRQAGGQTQFGAQSAPGRTIPEMPRKAPTAERRMPLSGAFTVENGPTTAEAVPGTRRAARERAQFDLPSKDEVSSRRSLSLPDVMGTVGFARRAWFILAFLAPIVIGATYLFLLAPDQYITEYRFSVRVPVGQSNSIANGGGAITAALGGNPSGGTDLLDNYTVSDYASSAQAARDLDAKVNLRALFNKPSDPFSKIGDKPTMEQLARYWQSMVYSNYDVASGLAVVRVKAYSAADSLAIATNLVSLSSDLVNSIGSHSQLDSVRFAQQQLDRANARVATLRGELANLRNQSQLIDPNGGLLAANAALSSQLLGRQSQLQAQRDTLARQLGNARAPQIVLLDSQIAALNKQLAASTQNSGAGAGQPPRAVTVGRFEDIDGQLKSALAIQASANAAVSNVQASSDSQRLYLTTYVQPTLPESAQGPNRWVILLIIILIAGMVWIIGRLIGNSVMDHA